MNSTKGVSGFVGENLPLSVGLDNHICGRNCLVITTAVLVVTSTSSAKHASPGQSNGGLGSTSGEQRPVSIFVLGFTTPLGKCVEAIVDGNIVAAFNVPRGVGGRSTSASSVDDGKVLDSQRDLKCALVDLGGFVHVADDLFLDSGCAVECCKVVAVCSNTNKSHFLGRRTTSSRANGIQQVEPSAASTTIINLPTKERPKVHGPK